MLYYLRPKLLYYFKQLYMYIYMSEAIRFCILCKHVKKRFRASTLLVDHQSLSQLNEQRLHTPWQHKVFTKLLGLQYKIVYQQGHTNRVAAALSRRLEPKFNVVSEVIPHG